MGVSKNWVELKWASAVYCYALSQYYLTETMKKQKRTINQETSDFIEFFGVNEVLGFMEILYDFYKMFDVDVEDDWVAKEVGQENANTVRMIRTCLMLSKIAELYAGKLCIIKTKFPLFYKRVYDHVNKNTIVN